MIKTFAKVKDLLAITDMSKDTLLTDSIIVEEVTRTFLEMRDRMLVPWIKRVLKAHRWLVMG